MEKELVIISLFFVFLFGAVYGQQAGILKEGQPTLIVQECLSPTSCISISSSVTIDANWRWLHNVGGYEGCFLGNNWNKTYCPDPLSCSTNCALEAVSESEYKTTYGITTADSELTLNFVTQNDFGINVGSRVYLMDDTNNYKILKLANKEFTFDVDDSELVCGLNGALYFIEMPSDGGLSAGNKAGAKFGTGYCDAQCPHDVKFINGEANLENWQSTTNNTGAGKYGSCCPEMDIWEANSVSTAYTPHPCSIKGLMRCEGDDCGDKEKRYRGVCDKDGCDFNPYRMGNITFYGPSMIVDTHKMITVVTQFITHDNTDTGDLVEIRRIYKQDGKVIYNSATMFDSLENSTSISDKSCEQQKLLFGEENDFKAKGGMKEMGEAIKRGMVLAMSLWVDHESHCLWLDSIFPSDSDPTIPGVKRGPCPITSGEPAELINTAATAKVKFNNIKWGPLGSTTVGVPAPDGSVPTAPPTVNPCNGSDGCKCTHDIECVKGLKCHEGECHDINNNIQSSASIVLFHLGSVLFIFVLVLLH